MDNKTGVSCSTGKTLLIDPNMFDGQDSSSNISVPLEDLSIYVQLETTKKARTILTDNIGVSSAGATVKFIEGSIVGGERVLTTSYTDLTTNFNEPNQSEGLGITSIDIDFNSSYAPLIVINFVDLRGSAIFQNEGNVGNNQNNFASFFQLPYPLFELTIKGYYGMPVKYQLHMTKFNALFNSKTGNFEITANFIGYTYAMFSDMLLGYLKAIAYTQEGIAKYDELGVMTLDELMIGINNIDKEAKKLTEKDPGVANLNKIDTKLGELNVISSDLLRFGQKLSGNDDLLEYKLVKANDANSFTAIVDYNGEVSKSIDKFNIDPMSNITLDVNLFTTGNMNIYDGLTINLLLPGTDSASELEKVTQLNKILENSGDVEGTRKIILNLFKDNTSSTFSVYDLRNQYTLIDDTRKLLEQEYTRIKIEVAKTLKTKIKEVLGVDPTIRNIVGIFTAAVEVFMSVLFNVSQEATKNEDRKKELAKKFTLEQKSFDIKVNSVDKVDKLSASGPLNPNFYPWPEYRKVDDIKGIEEQYLGDVGVLDDPTKVTELDFINRLLKAFLSSQKESKNSEIRNELDNTNWNPVNPLDTRIYIEEFPYKRINGNSIDELISYLMVRAFIYMGYSNINLTDDEVINFANSEADAILRDIIEEKTLLGLTQVTKTKFTDVKAKVNNNPTPVIKYLPASNEYYYNLIFESEPSSSIKDSKYKKALPLEVIDGKFEFNAEGANGGYQYLIDYYGLSVSNYTTTKYKNDDGKINYKEYDGGGYLKFLTPEDYSSSIKTTNNDGSTNVIELELLKKEQADFNTNPSANGLKQFSGSYAIQEFKTLNFGVTGLEKAEFRLMFYQDSKSTKRGSGLADKRKQGQKTPYDITTPKYKILKSDNVRLAIEKATDFTQTTGEENFITHDLIGENRRLLSDFIVNKSSEVSYPFIHFQVIRSFEDTPREEIPVGLFGSRLYNEQYLSTTSEYAKALLFLHTLPWNGLVDGSSKKGIFNINEILNTFGARAGFVSVPKLWAAFIGGLLWRSDTSETTYHEGTLIIKYGGSGLVDPISWHDGVESFIPGYTLGTPVPKRNQYITSGSEFQKSSMVFNNNIGGYIDLEDMLLQLPEDVKFELEEVFFDFVKKTDGISDWLSLKSKLEVYDKEPSKWKETWDKVMTDSIAGGGLIGDSFLSTTFMQNTYTSKHDGKLTFNDYIVFSPYDYNFKYNYFTELKDDSEGVKQLLQLLSDELYLVNTTYRIWQQNLLNSNEIRDGIYVSSDKLTKFIDTVISKFNLPAGSTVLNKTKQLEQEIFGTDNENLIKFQLYRTCKNIYDKWIGGSNSLDNLLFGDEKNRNGLNTHLSTKAGRGGNVSLIDSFRFVNRSFRDIGDELFINPTVVSDLLRIGSNSSFYEVVTSLLSSNHFDFIPLPSYINYGDPKILSKMFKPMTTLEAFDVGTVGPSFVCVYVGQPSKNLNINSSEYPNDGVDFRCNSEGSMMPITAKDFTLSANTYENNVAVFAVNYGQQNQNIFKDITLNQSEFSETAESLQITDDIANRGAENRRTYGGQNMYNVYSVRSYKTEVEMMGNAMIQPMMYFQLNNIPMFHGAYLITHVKHSIKPNSMSTNFTGVRIRNVETPILRETELFMSLLDSIGLSNYGDTTTNTTGFGGSSSASRTPKSDLKCNTIKKDVLEFNEIVKLIIETLEGSYYSGDINQFSKQKDKDLYQSSAETLWGLDRGKNKDRDLEFWKIIDLIKDKSKWTLYTYPKPNNLPSIFIKYCSVIKVEYDRLLKTANLPSELIDIINSDGRLLFNMVYLRYNGSGWFEWFSKFLKDSYNKGITNPDELLKIFVDERVVGGINAKKGLKDYARTIIADTGLDIQKMVGLGPYCVKNIA